MLQNIGFSKEINILLLLTDSDEYLKNLKLLMKKFDVIASGDSSQFILSDGSRVEYLGMGLKWQPVVEYEYQKEGFQ